MNGLPWKTSQLISDQHWLWDQRKHHQEHLPADPDVIWYSTKAHLQPDGQRLLPALPKIRHLPGTPEEKRVQVTVLKACDAASTPQISSCSCALLFSVWQTPWRLTVMLQPIAEIAFWSHRQLPVWENLWIVLYLISLIILQGEYEKGALQRFST